MIKKIRSAFSKDYSFFMAVPGLIWQTVFCIVPLLLIIAISFIDLTALSFTFNHFSGLFNFSHFKMIAWSLSLAFFITLGCLILGYPVAYYIARRIVNFKNLFLFFLVIPFWTNLIILIYSWIFILERNGILNSLLLRLGIISKPLLVLNSMFAVYLVAFYCYLPFMIIPLYNALEKIDPATLEASADLGATPTQTFFKVIVPGTWSGIRTGCFLVFVPVFGEFSIPLLMGGDKYMFVGNYISHSVFTALDFSHAAAFTLLSIAALVVGVLFLMSILKLCIKSL